MFSVSFLLLLSLALAPPDITLSVNGKNSTTPFSQELYTFETLVSQVPIFSFPLEATLMFPNGSIENVSTVDSLKGYKIATINFTEEGNYVLKASVAIGGTVQEQEKTIIVAESKPEMDSFVTAEQNGLLSGTIQTDTSANVSLYSTIQGEKILLCTTVCKAPSCSFSCPVVASPLDVPLLTVTQLSTSVSKSVSLLSFQKQEKLLFTNSSFDFAEGEENSFSLVNGSGLSLRAIHLDSSKVIVPTVNGEVYSFPSLLKGDYLLEAYKESNGTYSSDSLYFSVQSSPNVVSLNPVQNSLVYSPQKDALFLRTTINVEFADRNKPVLIQKNTLFTSAALLRDDSSFSLPQKDGFFVVAPELLSSVIEIEVRLSGSPFNPSPLLPSSRPTIEETTSFNSREFIIHTNATEIYRYEVPLSQSFSYIWDLVDNVFIDDYFMTKNNSLIIYTKSKDILILESEISRKTIQELAGRLFISKPLLFDSHSDISLPLDSSFSLESVKAISREGISQEVSFKDNQIHASNLPDFEYIFDILLNKNNESGHFLLPVQFIPNNTLSVSQPKDIAAFAGEQVTFSFILSNKLESPALVDILFNDDLVSLSSSEYEVVDNNKNGYVDTGILVPGNQQIISASMTVPQDYSPGTIIPLIFKFQY
ncbi:MAG: hypothetical protein KDK61_08800, partial [Simkania sp.]|nr:hypothetical protein [Simkania sp.]